MHKPLLQSIPLIGKFLKSDKLIKDLTPAQILRLGEAYHQVIGLGNNPSFAATAFKKLDAQRIEDNIKVAGAMTGPDGVSIIEKAKHPDATISSAANAVQTQVAATLKPSDAYDKAMSKFNKNVATFKDLVKRIPQGGFGAQDVISTMKYYVDKSRAAVVTQHNLDKQQLAAQFGDQTFKDNLMKTYSIDKKDADADVKIEVIKNNMIKDLTSAHKKQLSEFDKATSESLNTLHKAAAAEMQKMGVIETIKKANASNVAMLEILAEENRRNLGLAKDEPSGIMVNIDREKAKLSHAQLANIKQFQSITGMEIKQPQPGTFVMYFPTISPRYNQSLQQKPLADLLLIAQAIKAQGFDKIDWTIDIGDEDTLMERAKQAYMASVRSGILIDNISIRDGKGRTLKLEDVYKDAPSELRDLRQRENEIKAELQGLSPPKAEAAKITNVKAAMKNIRAEHLANPPAEEEEPDEEAEQAATASSSASGPK